MVITMMMGHMHTNLGNQEPGELGPGVLPPHISDVTCVGKEHLEENKELSSCGYAD